MSPCRADSLTCAHISVRGPWATGCLLAGREELRDTHGVQGLEPHETRIRVWALFAAGSPEVTKSGAPVPSLHCGANSIPLSGSRTQNGPDGTKPRAEVPELPRPRGPPSGGGWWEGMRRGELPDFSPEPRTPVPTAPARASNHTAHDLTQPPSDSQFPTVPWEMASQGPNHLPLRNRNDACPFPYPALQPTHQLAPALLLWPK